MRNVVRPTQILLPLKRAHKNERSQAISVIGLSTNDLLPNME